MPKYDTKQLVNPNEFAKLSSDLRIVMGQARYEKWIAEKFPHLNNLAKQNQDNMIMQANLQKAFADKLFFQIMLKAIQNAAYDDFLISEQHKEDDDWLKKMAYSNLSADTSHSVSASNFLQHKEKVLHMIARVELIIQHYENSLIVFHRINDHLEKHISHLEQRVADESNSFFADSAKLLQSSHSSHANHQTFDLFQTLAHASSTNTMISSHFAADIMTKINELRSTTEHVQLFSALTSLQDRCQKVGALSSALDATKSLQKDVESKIATLDKLVDENRKFLSTLYKQLDPAVVRASGHISIHTLPIMPSQDFAKIIADISKRSEAIHLSLAKVQPSAMPSRVRLFDKPGSTTQTNAEISVASSPRIGR